MNFCESYIFFNKSGPLYPSFKQKSSFGCCLPRLLNSGFNITISAILNQSIYSILATFGGLVQGRFAVIFNQPKTFYCLIWLNNFKSHMFQVRKSRIVILWGSCGILWISMWHYNNHALSSTC